MLETELKAMLTKSQFDKIKEIFTWDSIKNQINSYYISPDNLLKKHGITLRIRTIDNTHILQVKKHTSKNGALQISEVSEFELDTIPIELTEDDVYKYTGIKTTASLIGDLTTTRYSCFYSSEVEICLDKSTYLGLTDYEIEIEYTKPIPQALLDTLAKIDVLFDTPCKGKFSRFMGRLLG